MQGKGFKVAVFGFIGLLSLGVIGMGLYFGEELRHLSRMGKYMLRQQKNDFLIMDQVTSTLSGLMKTMGKEMILYPPQLERVICAEQLGIVTGVKRIRISNVEAPYNGSIWEKEGGGYHLFFRHDVPKNAWESSLFYSRIGYAEIGSDWSVGSVVEAIDTGSNFSEDPRIVKVGDRFYLSWNDISDEKSKSRSIRVGEWDPRTRGLRYITDLQQYISPIEKNWVPFEVSEGKKAELCFVYGIYPHKILALPNPRENEMIHLQKKGYTALHDLRWSKYWGHIRGGTPARLVNNEYLSFFHSSFKEGGKIWYVMGAYTFDKSPPHKIRSITPYPIVFPGIYMSDFLNTSDSIKYCIFPAGFAIEKKDEKTFLHVSCGENDSAVKIVTMNYERLRELMVPVR